MIENTHKYDNMHGNEIIYALLSINHHVLSCYYLVEEAKPNSRIFPADVEY